MRKQTTAEVPQRSKYVHSSVVTSKIVSPAADDRRHQLFLYTAVASRAARSNLLLLLLPYRLLPSHLFVFPLLYQLISPL